MGEAPGERCMTRYARSNLLVVLIAAGFLLGGSAKAGQPGGRTGEVFVLDDATLDSIVASNGRNVERQKIDAQEKRGKKHRKTRKAGRPGKSDLPRTSVELPTAITGDTASDTTVNVVVTPPPGAFENSTRSVQASAHTEFRGDVGPDGYRASLFVTGSAGR